MTSSSETGTVSWLKKKLNLAKSHALSAYAEVNTVFVANFTAFIEIARPWKPHSRHADGTDRLRRIKNQSHAMHPLRVRMSAFRAKVTLSLFRETQAWT